MRQYLFETSRLVARHIVTTDVDAMHRVYGDPEVVRWAGDGRPLDRTQCEHWIDVTRHNYAVRGYGMFALLERHSLDVAGFCGLVHPGGQPEVEIKYAFRRDCWGQGLATEAVTASLSYASTVLGIHRVIATVAPENTASQHVLLKVGMQRGKLVRDAGDGSFTQFFHWDSGTAGS